MWRLDTMKRWCPLCCATLPSRLPQRLATSMGIGVCICIYIHMHNVHNKSAPCLFQIVTAFSKSAKHFGKERKKQHINNIHCEGPPPTVQVSQSRNMGVTKVWALPCSKPGLSGGYLYNLWYNISIYIATSTSTSTSTSISIFIFIFISI